jgi:hypothetical protein
MSRSRRKTSVRGITAAASEKDDKQASHRKLRRRVRQVVAATDDPMLPLERELTEPWSMSKDGKMHFDPAKLPKLLRK